MASETIKPLPLDAPENKGIECYGDLRSLFWPLSDPPEISILSDIRDFDQPKELYIQEHGLHPISDESLVNPPVSSIEIAIDDFVYWNVLWEERHSDHDDDNNCLYRNDKGQILTTQEIEELESSEQLAFEVFSCCGESAPQLPLSVTVHASRKPFVTIADYIAALHPFLAAHRKQIIFAKSELNGGPAIPRNAELMVNPIGVTYIQVQEKEEWIRYRHHDLSDQPSCVRHGPPPVVDFDNMKKYPEKPMHIKMPRPDQITHVSYVNL